MKTMPDIAKIVVHWNKEGSTAPTVYVEPEIYNVDDGVLAIQTSATEVAYIPLCNIWHFNVVFKELANG